MEVCVVFKSFCVVELDEVEQIFRVIAVQEFFFSQNEFISKGEFYGFVGFVFFFFVAEFNLFLFQGFLGTFEFFIFGDVVVIFVFFQVSFKFILVIG